MTDQQLFDPTPYTKTETERPTFNMDLDSLSRILDTACIEWHSVLVAAPDQRGKALHQHIARIRQYLSNVEYQLNNAIP